MEYNTHKIIAYTVCPDAVITSWLVAVYMHRTTQMAHKALQQKCVPSHHASGLYWLYCTVRVQHKAEREKERERVGGDVEFCLCGFIWLQLWRECWIISQRLVLYCTCVLPVVVQTLLLCNMTIQLYCIIYCILQQLQCSCIWSLAASCIFAFRPGIGERWEPHTRSCDWCSMCFTCQVRHWAWPVFWQEVQNKISQMQHAAICKDNDFTLRRNNVPSLIGRVCVWLEPDEQWANTNMQTATSSEMDAASAWNAHTAN